MIDFDVKDGDVLEVPSDLLLLKYAQNFYGADAAVASRLAAARICAQSDLRPAPGEAVILETRGALASARVMFLGTPSLAEFRYDEMEVFARTAIEKILAARVPASLVTTTIHGTGYGLDGGEALQRLVRGFRQGLATHGSSAIERVVFVVLGERSQRMLSATLDAMATTQAPRDASLRLRPTTTDRFEEDSAPGPPRDTPVVRKNRVFVALPFSEEFQNVYDFGIYPAVRNCGFICERVDETHFTGDVLERIRGGIEAADLVIADLTEGRPNVYLEVGYAWGRGVPVIFVAKKGEKLHFDVSTHKCIFYGKFGQFAAELERLIKGLQRTRAD